MRYFVFLCVLAFCFVLVEDIRPVKKAQQETPNFYHDLIEKLSDVETKENLEKLFTDTRVEFREELILLNLDQPSIQSYTKHSLGPQALQKGKRFMKRHRSILEKAEKVYNIPKEIIVAILYIETNFDAAVAKYSIFNAYSSLAYADHPKYLTENLAKLKQKYAHLTTEELAAKLKVFEARSLKKAVWAVTQLRALFQVTRSMNRHILDLKGSFAGAMGYPQFIPTSYISYAVDGNCDYLIDLYNIHDAIFSVANYLRMQGFHKESVKSQQAAVYHYNNNDDYVSFVLQYSKKL